MFHIERLEDRLAPSGKPGMEFFLFAVDVTPPSAESAVVVHPSPEAAHEGLRTAEMETMATFSWDKCGAFPRGIVR